MINSFARAVFFPVFTVLLLTQAVPDRAVAQEAVQDPHSSDLQLDISIGDSAERELVLEERWRTQVHRTRIYGVITGAGGALAIAGTIGAIRTVYTRASSVWATVGLVGAGVMVVGAIGLLTSGIRRRRVTLQRRELGFDASVEMSHGSLGGSLVLRGVW